MGTTFWASSRRGIACLAALVAVVAAFLCLARRADAASPVPVIVDTDIYSNADDVGALASAFALQKEGAADLLAVTVNYSTADRSGVATDSWKCAAAIDNFYGSPSIPIGAQTPNDEPAGTSRYVGDCAKLAPASAPAPASAVSVLTKALTQSSGGVVLVETGYEQNLEDLLKSSGGAALVAAKVSELVVTGGWYPSSTATTGVESNFGGDPLAAQYVAANWPTKIVWDGDEVGVNIATGYSVAAAQPVSSPIRVSFDDYAGPGNNIVSYDPVTLYHALVPSDPSLTETGPGTNALDQYGDNTFTAGTGTQYYLTLNSADIAPLDASIEALYDVLPSTGSISGTVKDASTGTGVGGVQVRAYDGLGNLDGSTTTSSTGTYTLPGLYGSNYTIDFTPTAGSSYQSSSDTGVSLAGGGSAIANAALILPAPTNKALPTISGNAQVGQTLTESHGTWSVTPTKYTYQWESCSGGKCSAIAGATSQHYTVGAGDVGNTIRVQESATDDGGTSAPATSAPTAVVPASSSGGQTTTTTHHQISSAKLRKLLTKVLAAHGKQATLGALLRNDGYSFSFNAPAPGHLTIDWYQLLRHGKKLLVARVSVIYETSGSAKIKLVLTRKGRTLLGRSHTVKISARASFAPAGGKATHATKSLKLRS
jgi:hypothetical protein